MNELVRELAEQSKSTKTSYFDGRGNVTQTYFDQEKFAELIIKEALGDLKERIALRYQGSEKDRDIAYGMEIVYFDIVDKFGVK
jgi:hypothetical protein